MAICAHVVQVAALGIDQVTARGALGQLTERAWSAHGTVRSQEMRYDPMGRITRTCDPEGVIHPWLRDPAGDLITIRRGSGGRREAIRDHRRWSFDAAGQMVERAVDARVDHFSWDARRRLVGFTSHDGVSARYGYDASGRRSFKEVDGVRTTFAWSGDVLVAEVTEEQIVVEDPHTSLKILAFVAV